MRSTVHVIRHRGLSAARDLRVVLGCVVATLTLTAASDRSLADARPPGTSATTAATSAAADDSTAVVAVVTGFHAALASGDSSKALSFLDPAVVILESGDEEHLADYRAHHLAADIEFARAVRTTVGAIRVAVRGDVAWALSTSETSGTFRGRQINSAGAELIVLTRTESGWRIAAIHWSSHSRRAR